MAQVRNEKEEKGFVSDGPACDCKGDNQGDKRPVNNSIRGAALSLCMTVDELLELLQKRDARLSWASTDVAKLARIAELESTVKELQAEVERLNENNKALANFVMIAL